MNLNDSSASNTTFSAAPQQTLGKIVANVVDMQHNLISQYNTIKDTMESLRHEHNSSIQMLREDFRRLDDRTQKQIDEINKTHNREVERLMDIIKSLLTKKESEAPVRPTPQQVYSSAVPPGAFFGGQGDRPNQSFDQQQMQLAMLQQMALAQQMSMPGVSQYRPQFSNPQLGMQQPTLAQRMVVPQAPSSISGSGIGVQLPNVAPPASVAVSMPSSTATSVAPIVPVLSPPKPTVHKVNLPISESKPKVETETKDEKASPVVPSSTTAKITFGTPANQNSSLSTLFKPTPPPTNLNSSSASASLTFQPIKSPQKQDKEQDNEGADDDDHEEEYEAQVDFKPIVPLPDLVKVVTGEEEEEVVFEERCKLYRYVTDSKEWKERGTGNIRVLKDPKTGLYRIVMRREQVHKVCANHKLSSTMSIKKKGEKAVQWFAADFSEEVLVHEQLSAKFASSDTVDRFIKVFDEGVAAAAKASPIKATDASDQGSIVEIPKSEKAKAGAVVEIPKAEEKPKPKEDSKPTPTGFGDQFKKKEGEWDCTGCYTRIKAGEDKCACCGTNRDGSKSESDIFSKPSALPPTTGQTPKFSFGMAAAAAAKEEIVTTPKPKPVFGAASGFTFGSSPSGSIFGGNKPADPQGASTFSFVKKDTTASSESSTTAASKPTFSFAVPKASSADSSTAAASSNFFFKPATASSPNPETKSLFGKSSDAVKADSPAAVQGKTENKVFGQGLVSSPISFASVSTNKDNIFSSGPGINKTKSSFSGITDKASADSSLNTTAVENDDGKGADEEYEPDVDFKPVVPLPELVEVKTGEEDEEVISQWNARLYRYESTSKEWKERGRGEAKVLKNPANGKHRLVMRREQVHKLCANFNITTDIKFELHNKSPCAVRWICFDFSEDPEGRNEIMLMKFKTEDLAKKFLDVMGSVQQQE